MITEKYIMGLVRRYADTPQGRAEIKRKYGVEYREDISDKELISYGEKMKQILFEHINREIRSVTLDDIIVEDPQVDKQGRVTLKISFKEGSLHRDSLYLEGYPEGLENIILLFARGYHAKDYVYGLWNLPNRTWRGGNDFVGVRSRKDRAPSNFLYNAISEFNSISNGIAVARLEEKYK